MRSDTIRFKLGLFLVVPLIALGFIAVYSALDWWLVEKTGWLALDHEVVSFWIPIALASVLVITLVDPRIAVLKLNEERNIPFLFTIVAIALIAAPAVIAQNYIHAMSGTLVQIADPNMIGPPLERYYRANHICLDRAHAAAASAARSSGRYNERVTLYLYEATPLCGGKDAVRIGLIYSETINNRLSESEKDALYKAFVKRSLTRFFSTENPASYTYLERIGPGADLREFEKALREHRVANSPIILVPHTDPFDMRAGGELKWIARIFGGGALGWLIMVLLAPIDRSKLLHPEKVAKKRENEKFFLRMFLIPSRINWGLPLLLDTNVLVYLAMVMSGLGVVSFQADDLIAWGGNFGPALHGLGVIRLFTSQFVHGGLMHVASNMYGLVFAGLFLIPVAHNARLVWAYLLCGLGGSLASVYMHPDIVSVGASGAIFGLFGMLLALVGLGDKRLADARSMILINTAVFVGLNLIIGAATPAVDTAAHVGGLVVGLALGAVLTLIDRRKRKP